MLPIAAPITGVALVALGAAMWGTDGALRAPLVARWSPWTIVLFEHVILTALVAVPLIRRAVQLRDLDRRAWAAIIGVSWGGSAVATVAFTFAFRYGNPDVVVLLQKTQPLWAVAVAAGVLGERPRRRLAPLALGALAGTYLLSFGLENPGDAVAGAAGRAALLALAAAALWGCATVLGRFALGRIDANLLTGLRFSCALPLLAVFALTQGALGPPASATGGDWGRLGLLAVVSGLAGMILYYRGLRSTPASIATFAELAFPATALIVNFFALGATVTAWQLAGFALLWATIGVLHRVPVVVPSSVPRQQEPATAAAVQ